VTLLDTLTAVTLGLRRARAAPIQRDFLRFPLTSHDQARVTGPVQADDVAYAAAPAAGAAYPQSLRLRFSLRDPASGAPQLRPLFPGKLTFIADPAAPGVAPGAADISRVNYPGWRTFGTLMVELSDQEVARAFAAFTPGLEVRPNRMWYARIRVTEAFLFDTLPRVAPTDFPRTKAGVLTPDGRQALSDFLKGTRSPELGLDRRQKAKAKNDPARRLAMPAMQLTGADVDLTVTAALAQDPHDGPAADFDAQAAGVARTVPAHPRNGAIPARLVYKSAAAANHLVDAGPADAVAAAALADWPAASAVRYFPVRCTRIWKPEADCSVHFPWQVLAADRPGPPAVAFFRQRLPAHGIVYLSLTPAQQAQGTSFSLSVSSPVGQPDHELRWLDGTSRVLPAQDEPVPDNWRLPAGTDPVAWELDPAAKPALHLVLRRRMRVEMLAEPHFAPGGARCTYMSMRRSVRALVNNRIAGGRLNFGAAVTSAPTRKLIEDAWALRRVRDRFLHSRAEFAAAKGVRPRTVTSASLLAANEPDPNAAAGRASWLKPMLEAFFPLDAPAVTIDGSQERTKVLSLGQVAYAVWQSQTPMFQNKDPMFRGKDIKRNFSDVGHGGPGALVLTGLASEYHLDPERIAAPPEADPAYFNRIVAAMLDGLQPGAVLQFWNLDTDFEAIKARTLAGDPPLPASYGHSPVFLRYPDPAAGEAAGIWVIDQTGAQHCPRRVAPDGSDRLDWPGITALEQIWIAANWAE
jgi:hypothetical protein